jgi:hypothetical protein
METITNPSEAKAERKVEPVVLLLFVGMVVFTVALFACETYFPNDGQMFQVVAGLLTGFSGAFFMRVKPSTQTQDKRE